MNVLSLFDGMSCGQIALERANIKVSNYFASEIKPHAIKVTKHNYPKTKHIGSVLDVNWFGLPKIDLLIGGSPCQDISNLKPGNNIYDEKSKLFFEYVRIYKEQKDQNPDFKFLLENVNGCKKSIDVISEIMGVDPIRINSNLVTYQNRDRLYWTNIPGVTIPENKNISYQSYKETDYYECLKYKVNQTPSRMTMWGNGINGKCPNVTYREKINCLTVKQDRWSNSGLVEFEDFCRYLTVKECETAQTVPIGYTSILTTNQAWDLLGDGWTVDVIAHIFSFLK